MNNQELYNENSKSQNLNVQINPATFSSIPKQKSADIANYINSHKLEIDIHDDQSSIKWENRISEQCIFPGFYNCILAEVKGRFTIFVKQKNDQPFIQKVWSKI